MKTELLNKDGSKTPPRPNWYADKEGISKEAVESIFADKYCPFDKDDKEQLAEDLAKHWYSGVDMFDLAKDFEWGCWDVDREFIDSLDLADSHLSTAIRERIKKWGEDNDIDQPLPIGTELDCGVIDSVYEYEPACYCVKMWEEQENPTTRRLVKWEDAVLKGDVK